MPITKLITNSDSDLEVYHSADSVVISFIYKNKDVTDLLKEFPCYVNLVNKTQIALKEKKPLILKDVLDSM